VIFVISVAQYLRVPVAMEALHIETKTERETAQLRVFRIPIGGPGSLFISVRPRGADWLADEIAALAGQGIGVLVSLLEGEEQAELGLEHEGATCASHHIEFVAMPVPDLGAPIETRAFVQNVHRLTQLLREGVSIAVHCRQSVGRSGLLAVSIAVASGMSLESALEVVSLARGVRVPETDKQTDWLRSHVNDLSAPR